MNTDIRLSVNFWSHPKTVKLERRLGLSEGIMPSSMAKTPEDLDEEQRVFYVGVTRARDVLVLSPRHEVPVSRFLEHVHENT